MGRLSLNGIDNVLVGKMQTIIDGVNSRVKLDLENGTAASSPPPSITYEQFVEELDLGDSFTSMLFEALVKEMAERRLRAHQPDKRMISRRTQRLLTNLQDHSRVLRPESRMPPRSFYSDPIPGLAWEEDDQLLRNTLLDADDDDDDTIEPSEMFVDAAGSRSAAELYDSYYSSRPLRRHAPFFSRSASTAAPSDSLAPPPSGIFDDVVWGTIMRAGVAAPPPPPVSGANSTSASGTTPSGATVTRSNSIRRAARSRVDFSDFSARRRQSTRVGVVDLDPAAYRVGDDVGMNVAALVNAGPGTSTAAGSSSVALPPWSLPSVAGSATSRAVSGSARYRRSNASLGSESFLLRSVTSPPPYISRDANATPSEDHPGDRWVHLQNADVTPSSSHPLRLAVASASGELQILTPRSSTPADDAAPAAPSHSSSSDPAAAGPSLPTPVPTSVASVAGSQAPGSP